MRMPVDKKIKKQKASAPEPFTWKDIRAYREPEREDEEDDEGEPKTEEELWTDAILEAMLSKRLRVHIGRSVLEKLEIGEFKECDPRMSASQFAALTELYPIIREGVRAYTAPPGAIFKCEPFGEEELFMDIVQEEKISVLTVCLLSDR
jgi:hypothetical protein